MTTPATSPDLPDDGYVLARTSEEYQRLRRQARLWEQVTAQALDRVGIGAGMRCLDVGCGPGPHHLAADWLSRDLHPTTWPVASAMRSRAAERAAGPVD